MKLFAKNKDRQSPPFVVFQKLHHQGPRVELVVDGRVQHVVEQNRKRTTLGRRRQIHECSSRQGWEQGNRIRVALPVVPFELTDRLLFAVLRYLKISGMESRNRAPIGIRNHHIDSDSAHRLAQNHLQIRRLVLVCLLLLGGKRTGRNERHSQQDNQL